MPEQLAQAGIDKDSPLAEVNKNSSLELGNENKNHGAEEKTIPTLNISKTFKLKHIFKKVSALKDGKIMKSPPEEHFGLRWRLSINRCNGYIHVKARCLEHREDNDWTMELIPTINAVTENQKYICCIKKLPILSTKSKVNCISSNNFIKWEDLNKSSCVINDSLTIEAEIVIKKTTGGKKLRDFGDSMKKFSDVALVVQEQKFYVSKLCLATHSPYFESLFFGSFQESQQSEVQLHDIDPFDFQKYLEVLYGEDAIDDRTVEGILLVADSNDTNLVKLKCQQFLLGRTNKSSKKIFEIFVKYHLDEKKIISNLQNIDEVKLIVPDDLEILDKNIMATLLQKCISSQH